eukprot:TRINITY_DN1346_c3_g1_i1.p1 TRINITY_DN1346_c3_g1~~TRINITY_DN1346_c3_g1_i1.p1  ORF type:complete len:747 (+),score=117.00 TRINITY_DN1346_c3_g1_i1:747-2987(+)
MFECVYRRVLSDEDTDDDVRNKQLVAGPGVVLVVVLPLIYLYWAVTTGVWFDSYRTGLLLIAAAFVIALIHMMRTKQLPIPLVQALALTVCAGIICLDWASAGSPGSPRLWSMSIIVVDMLLVMAVPAATVKLIIGAVLFWLFLTSVEDCLRFGLYRMDHWSTPTDDELENAKCDDPPCAVTAFSGVFRAFAYSLVFLLDFYFTRGFAVGMRQQMDVVEASIRTAEDIAVLLADYETDAAKEIVEGAEDSTMPPRLRAALQQLLTNLCLYRSFLPQSCLPGQWRDDGDSSSAPSSARSVRSSKMSTAKESNSQPPGLDSRQGTVTVHASVGLFVPNAGSSSPGPRSLLAPGSPRSRRRSSPKTLRLSLRREKSLRSESALSESRLSHPREAPRARTQEQLSKKHCTFVAANVRGYLALPCHATPSQITSFHDEALSKMHSSVALHKGITEYFIGDRFFASLNGVRYVPGHRSRGAKLCHSIHSLRISCCGSDLSGHRSSLKSGAGDRPDSSVGRHTADVSVSTPVLAHSPCHGIENVASVLDEGPVQVSTACFSAECVCGVIGTDTQKRFSFIGHVVTWAKALERVATRRSAMALVNASIRGDSDVAFHYKFCEYLRLAKHPDEPAKIYEMKEKIGEAGNEEWMYQLARQGHGEWSRYNRAAEALIHGDFEAAMEAVEEAITDFRDSKHTPDTAVADCVALERRIAAREMPAANLLHEAYVQVTDGGSGMSLGQGLSPAVAVSWAS